MTEGKLKEGDYLWEIGYYPHKKYSFTKLQRDIKRYKIKKVNEKSYTMFYGFKVMKSEIGTEYFASKYDAIKYALKEHEQEFGDAIKEIESLRKLLKTESSQ